MFPTHVGMNRARGQELRVVGHVPHTRGDEPKGGAKELLDVSCSPHTWG